MNISGIGDKIIYIIVTHMHTHNHVCLKIMPELWNYYSGRGKLMNWWWMLNAYTFLIMINKEEKKIENSRTHSYNT